MPDTPSRREAEEIHRIVTAAVRECWETYAMQFGEGTAPSPEALDAILARATVPIVAQLEKIPPEGIPELTAALVTMMLGAFLDVTAHELAREHKRMLDVPEREATKFAARAAKEIEVARRLAQLDAEVKRLRLKAGRRGNRTLASRAGGEWGARGRDDLGQTAQGYRRS